MITEQTLGVYVISAAPFTGTGAERLYFG